MMKQTWARRAYGVGKDGTYLKETTVDQHSPFVEPRYAKDRSEVVMVISTLLE